jgi:hypothetical protein
MKNSVCHFGKTKPGRNLAVVGWLLILFLPLAVSAQTLTHRYSLFNTPNGSTTVTDSVAAANGTVQGGATVTGGQLVLNGASGTYLNLPAGLITGASAVTLEAWADFGTLPVNCYLFSLGNTDASGAGEDYIFCAPQAARITISGVDPGYNSEQNATSGTWSGQKNLHVVAIYNPPGKSLAVYTNGVLAGMNTNETVALSSVNDVHSYLGRSLYTADPYAPLNVDEFRIYSGAMSAPQVALDAAAGPTQIITSPGALGSIQLTLTNQMTTGSQQQAVVTGNFANVTNVNLFTYGSPTVVSDNTNVLTVSTSGLVTAQTPGASANIIATYGGLSVTQKVAVAGFATGQFIFDTFGDGYWTIINQGNTNTLVVNSSGAAQETYTNGAQEQQFQVLYNLKNGTFRLRQQSSWFFIGAQNGTPVTGGAVTVIPFYTGAASQQWYLVNAGGGYYRIFNAASNLVLQTDNGNPAIVTLAQPSASPFQRWQFNYQTHYFKKGTAGYEGPPYSTELQTSWAYNYDDNTGSTLPARFAYIPMIDTEYWEPVSDLQSRDAGWVTSLQQVYLLGFNEPDNTGTASTNPSTNTAIAMWPSLQALNVPLVSPAMQNTGDAWENSFFQMIAANNYRVDYTAVHEYVPPNAASLISTLKSAYTAYGRPVWLTEFSPVDWSGNQGWTEDDDYNFLAEFMWQAEDQDWLKRYAIFPFTGTNALPPYQSTTVGYRGNFFLTGSTLSPYGELYATWDADRTLRGRIPYILHNLGTSFRLVATNAISAPRAATIYSRNATTEWALMPAPTTNHWYIISLNDGRRLCDTVGNLTLVPAGTTGGTVEWTFTGPDSSGYYFIANPLGGHNLNGSGTAPAILFGTVSSTTQNNNTRWRLVKPYQPVAIATNLAAPTMQSATPGDRSATLSWSGSNLYYNVYRSVVTGGPYTLIAGATTNTTFVDTAVTNGVKYFYVVNGMDILGDQSSYSAEAVVQPVSLSSVQLNCSMAGNGIQFTWPTDHTGWQLQVQTNSVNIGLSTNWVTMPGSTATNLFSIPLNLANGSVFFRLVSP